LHLRGKATHVFSLKWGAKVQNNFIRPALKFFIPQLNSNGQGNLMICFSSIQKHPLTAGLIIVCAYCWGLPGFQLTFHLFSVACFSYNVSSKQTENTEVQ